MTTSKFLNVMMGVTISCNNICQFIKIPDCNKYGYDRNLHHVHEGLDLEPKMFLCFRSRCLIDLQREHLVLETSSSGTV